MRTMSHHFMHGLTGVAREWNLTRRPWLRHMALGALSRLGTRDITIGHHWVPDRPVHLNAFRHKGYWFHGKRREQAVMTGFARLIRPGASVIELGGHIGYISLYLAYLAGDRGTVHVFEPSPDNLRYLEPNVAGVSTIELVRMAASDRSGRAQFFIEDLTGQNSTLIRDYAVFANNREKAFSEEGYRVIDVATATLDDFLAERTLSPDFIKIDIEGAEIVALKGMSECLRRHRPTLMVEVTREEDAVMTLLHDADYIAYDERLNPLAGRRSQAGPNRFFLPAETPPPAPIA